MASALEIVLSKRVVSDVARMICELTVTPTSILECRCCSRCLLYEERLPVVQPTQEGIVVILDRSSLADGEPLLLWVNGYPLTECSNPRHDNRVLYRLWKLASLPNEPISCHISQVPTHIQLTLGSRGVYYFENRATMLQQHQWYICLNSNQYYCFHCHFLLKHFFGMLRKKYVTI